jgi:hypothetical protein
LVSAIQEGLNERNSAKAKKDAAAATS